jgi:hypothetical protein
MPQAWSERSSGQGLRHHELIKRSVKELDAGALSPTNQRDTSTGHFVPRKLSCTKCALVDEFPLDTWGTTQAFTWMHSVARFSWLLA